MIAGVSIMKRDYLEEDFLVNEGPIKVSPIPTISNPPTSKGFPVAAMDDVHASHVSAGIRANTIAPNDVTIPAPVVALDSSAFSRSAFISSDPRFACCGMGEGFFIVFFLWPSLHASLRSGTIV